MMIAANAAVIARLDRATQYSRDGRVQPGSRGVLDRPVKPGDDTFVVAGIFAALAMTGKPPTSFRGARSANYDVQSYIGESRATISGFRVRCFASPRNDGANDQKFTGG
ncbi:MAG: hypothetical protein Q7U92_23930 [Bradyrhizobium sp.]|nr:hypothetical protein [Bradyrhizobium sp.]